MKNLRIKLLLVLALFTTIGFAQKFKVGHVDYTALIIAMPETKAAETSLGDYTKSLETTLQNLGKEYQTKVADFQANEKLMSDIIKNTKISEITDLEKRITEFQKSAEEDIKKKEQELMLPIREKINKGVKEVAKENGYAYILEASTILYFEEANDVSPLVKAKLGLK